MQFFGTTLFEKKKVEKLYDFAQHGLLRMPDEYGNTYIQLTEAITDEPLVKSTKPKKVAEKVVTPKEIYVAQTLNQPEFSMDISDTYIDEQIHILHQKLEVMGGKPGKPGFLASSREISDYMTFREDGAVRYGREEVKSMIERLNNRKKLKEQGSDFAPWPYTTNDAIRDVLAANKHLEAKLADASVPDLPGDAVNAIQDYQTLTREISGKDPVFYLIKEKQDREAIERKRDPILLAQSPFGFFWQILGAWDKEVVLLDEL